MRELSDREVAAIDTRALIDACAGALAALGRGDAIQAEKQLLPTPDGGFFLSISAVVPELGWAITKWGSYVPAADGSGRSSSTILASPATGGAPTAMLRGMLPTRLRTAASALALLEALGRIDRGATVGLAGFGPTNAHIAEMLASTHRVRSWRVLARATATLDRASEALSGQLTTGTDAAVLADADVVISATGATAPILSTALLRDDATVLCLEGRAAWDVRDAVDLDDHSVPGDPGGIARLMAGLGTVPTGRVFLDQAGSAVTDVALVSALLGAPGAAR
ncbi:hypothetical protein [Homoserinibacter sp. GY 40078]|uniref:hypothetical protein n=1 Tax=Homoserinibacter sp. GY 40078 TaxID=2603275 RepID=UPI0011CCDC93|nr:hypothetical protein [Homoserinibacter sp. GY 40078]TXK19295.1 hypothetical protein FVQ89_05105 [Homoserinibacter sp. GY 40078]